VPESHRLPRFSPPSPAGHLATVRAAAHSTRRRAADDEALDDLEYAVAEMAQVLRFYERVLTERGFRRPY
jgi:hypothetical protein